MDSTTGYVTCEFLNPDLIYINESRNLDNIGNLFKRAFNIEQLFNKQQDYKKSGLKAPEEFVGTGEFDDSIFEENAKLQEQYRKEREDDQKNKPPK